MQRQGIGDWPTGGEQPPELWFGHVPFIPQRPAAPPAPPRQPPVQQARPRHPLVTAGFTVALIGACISWLPIVGFGCGIFGFVFAFAGLRALPRRAPGRDMAIAGVVLACIGVGIGVIPTAILATVGLDGLFGTVTGN